MRIKMVPPKIFAFPAKRVPAILPREMPTEQIKKVTKPIIKHANNASANT